MSLNTPFYLINYMGGMSGAFLTSIVHNLFYTPKNLEVSESGNAHHSLDRYDTNWDRNSTLGYNINVTKIYDYLRPIDNSKPLIACDHGKPDFDRLFSIYPNAKVLTITCDLNEMNPVYILMRMLKFEGNMFYNEHMKGSFTDRPANYTDLTPEQCEIFFSKSHTVKPDDYFNNKNIPSEYSDKIYFIEWEDILFKQNKLLTQLENITGQKRNDQIIIDYQNYQNAQLKFFDKYLAHLNLRTKIE